MGADYYAYAVIGVEVTGLLHDVVLVPRCSHNHGQAGKFCPQCGASTSPKEERRPKPFYDDVKEQVAGWPVTFSTDHDQAFIGLVVQTDYRIGPTCLKLSPSPEPSVGDRLRQALVPLGLWDESKFGLWAILYCSY